MSSIEMEVDPDESRTSGNPCRTIPRTGRRAFEPPPRRNIGHRKGTRLRRGSGAKDRRYAPAHQLPPEIAGKGRPRPPRGNAAGAQPGGSPVPGDRQILSPVGGRGAESRNFGTDQGTGSPRPSDHPVGSDPAGRAPFDGTIGGEQGANPQRLPADEGAPGFRRAAPRVPAGLRRDRKSTRLNSSHVKIS